MKFTAKQIGDAMGIDFTPEQRDAIAAPLAPAVIVAGAGAGKTAVMAARVVYLVANGEVRPEEVLGLTYTNLATGELASRIRRDLAKLAADGEVDFTDSEEPTVKTYHSFASDLVAEFGLRVGLEPDLLNIADARRQQLVAELLRGKEVDGSIFTTGFDDTIKKILSLDDELSNCDVSIAKAIGFDEELAERIETTGRGVAALAKTGETARARIELLRLVERFRELKRHREFIDYADMPRYALEVARSIEGLPSQLRQRYRVVLLDEYQDTSIAQRNLMKLLFSAGHPVTAVGDPMQCIFAFNGSSPSNMTRFVTDFPLADGANAPVHNLALTQRNGQNIVALANLLTPKLRAVSSAPELQPAHPPLYGPGRVQLASFPTADEEAEWLLQEFGRLADEEQIPREEMVVLLRTNAQVAWFYAKCIESGVPAQIRGKRVLLEVPELAELVSTLRIVADPSANPHWARVLGNPRWRLGLRDLAEVGRVARSLASGSRIEHPKDWLEALEHAVEATDSVDLVAFGDAVEEIAAGRVAHRLSPEAAARVSELAKEIAYLRSHTGEPLADFVFRAARVTGLLAEAGASDDRVRRGMHVNLRSMLSLVAEFNSLDGESSLFAFLDWLDDAERFKAETRLDGPVHKGAIQLMTAHSAKGLQFRAVSIPRLAEGMFPKDEGRDKWISNAGVLPLPLRDEEMSRLLREFPDTTDYLAGKDFDEWRDAVNELDALDERRLIYVSITRTRDVLLLSTSFAKAGEKSERAPSAFWQELHDELVELGAASVGPLADFTGAAQPLAPTVGVWPAALDSEELAATRELAMLVNAARSSSERVDETSTLAEFDAAIAALESEFKARELPVRSVPLPDTLSVSQLMALNADPEAFTRDLLRPMPKAPALAAERGTAFHAWVEERAKRMAGPGIQLALPYEDEPDLDFDVPTPLDPDQLRVFRENFEASEWANRVPAFIEFPFSLAVGGRVLRGRIDAVFQDPLDGAWQVVDWKTNSRATADPLQLSVYRLAVAAALGCEPDLVKAGFYYVALNETKWLASPLDLAGVAATLAGA